jgi:hypothetical protein
MRILRSRLGWFLVAVYLAGFVAAYFDALKKQGTFLSDLALDLAALPYIVVVGRFLLMDPTFALYAHEPWGLVPAVVFCSALVLLLSAAIESAARRGSRLVRTRASSDDGKPAG